MMARGRKTNIENGRRPFNRSEYFKEYYEKNRASIASRRKEKYDSDPEYRNRVIQASFVYREKKDAEVERLIDMGVLSRPKRIKKEKKVFVDINGDSVEAFGFSEFVSSIKKNKVTVRNWIKRSIIPDTPFKTAGGNRLYTNCMVGVVLSAIGTLKIVKKESGVFDKIVRGWINCGIEENVIVEEKEE